MNLKSKPYHLHLFFSFILISLFTIEHATACSLQFTSPSRGSTVFTSSVNVSGTGSGNANPGAVGTVTATINGTTFFQQTGTFTTLINFFGSGSASVSLQEGPNLISVNGSVQGCSAMDSMVIYYEPQIDIPSKMSGEPELCTGNPINTATGNKFQIERLYDDEGVMPAFSYYKNSNLAATDLGLGYGWSALNLKKIIRNGTTLLVMYSTGKSEKFTNINGSWEGDPDSQLTIEENTLGYLIKKPYGESEQYNQIGQLLSTTNQYAQQTLYEYNSLGLMSLITSPFGRTLSLSYDDSARLSTVTAPDGKEYHFNYDAIGNLSSVTYPDDTPLVDTDNSTRLYHYENANFPHHLTGITDENGQRYVTWAYDTEGRAISSEHADGVDNNTLAFHPDGSVTVTNPLGKDTTYHFTNLHGVKKVTQVEGHATESCAGANQHYTYDANGYLASKTDWQGNLTTYIHDSRGLEISRTEAVGTPAERTITTLWHADFRLPIKIIEPSQFTNFIYDASGRLLSQSTHELQ